MNFLEKPEVIPLAWIGDGASTDGGSALFNDIADVLGNTAVVEEARVIDGNTNYKQLCKSFEDEGIAAGILGDAPREIMLQLPSPIILWDHRGYRFSLMTWDLITYLRANGMEIYNSFSPDDVNELVVALGCKTYLQKSRILMFGDINSTGALASQWDFDRIRGKFGVEVVPTGNDELVDAAASISDNDARSVLGEWKQNYIDKIVEPSEEDVLETARLYLGYKKLLEEKGANAIANRCVFGFKKGTPPEEQITGGNLIHFPTPCMAEAVLKIEGIACACESDLNVLLTMMIMSYISKQPLGMGNVCVYNQDRFFAKAGVGMTVEDEIEDYHQSLNENLLRFAHCSGMGGITSDIADGKYILRDLFGRGEGVTLWADVRTDQEVTLARLSVGLDEMQLVSGRIIDVTKNEEIAGFKNSAKIAINNTKDFLRNAYSHHYVMASGRYIGKLGRVCDIMNIKQQIL